MSILIQILLNNVLHKILKPKPILLGLEQSSEDIPQPGLLSIICKEQMS